MLEVRIEELTKAVQELTRVISERFEPNADGHQAPKEDRAEDPNDPPKSKATTDTSPPSSPASATEVTYEDVKRATIEVSKKSKDKAVAALARFGVTTAKALPQDQWFHYVNYMNRVLDGETDPGASE